MAATPTIRRDLLEACPQFSYPSLLDLQRACGEVPSNLVKVVAITPNLEDGTPAKVLRV